MAIRTTLKKASCPKCGMQFELKVQCLIERCEGKIEKGPGIGYLLELKCKECGTRFPYLIGTGTVDEFNSAIKNNIELVKEDHFGTGGVSVAQGMLLGLSMDELMKANKTKS